LTEGPGPTSRPGSLPAPRVACHCSPVGFDRQHSYRWSSGCRSFRSIAGALQYLTLTRPDLAYAVQQVCLLMHVPQEPYLALIKRILRYVKGTLSSGLHIGAGRVDTLTAYFDADRAGCPNSRHSTSTA
jgi:hypothetical protein